MPLTTSHSQIESQIESFVESFRKNGSVFINHLTTLEQPRSSSSLGPALDQTNSQTQENSWDPLMVSGYRIATPLPSPIHHYSNHYSNNHHRHVSSSYGSSCYDSSSCEDGTLSDNDETMEDGGQHHPLTVRDVAELLHARYAIIAGGRTADNHPIITFPDLGTFCSLSDEDYKKLMLYLTSVPTMHEADLGFVLIVDRRNDKWSAVKTVLLKISGYFPGLIQEVFVLRPLGFFQKAISEVSNKLFKEEFKFKLVVCSDVEELHEHICPAQLTPDLGGTVAYCHEDWIEQRVAVEKFTSNLHEISGLLHELTRRLDQTEFPNDVESTRSLLEDQGGEYKELKDDIQSALRHGETLLSCIRQPAVESPMDLCPNRLINVTAVERLLVQLDETEKGFDSFWSEHEKKLSACLELRRFEYDFKELQANLVSSRKELMKVAEAGDSLSQVDLVLTEMQRFKLIVESELNRAEKVAQNGRRLICRGDAYGVDSVAPKCLELETMVSEISAEVARKIDILNKHRDLQQRIEKANRWCAKGVDVLAGQQIENAFAEVALKELNQFLNSSKDFHLSDPKEFHAIFKDVSMSPETRALVQQVLKRVEDVQIMCAQRRSSLQKLVSEKLNKPIRPIQAVVPKPAVPLPLQLATGHQTSCPTCSSACSVCPTCSSVPTIEQESSVIKILPGRKSPDIEKRGNRKTKPKVQEN